MTTKNDDGNENENESERENERRDEPRKVKDISHTHPHHDEPFGATGTYDRGGTETPAGDAETEADDDEDEEDDPRVADGGRRGTATDDEDGDRRTVGDRDHSPPDGVEAQNAYDREPRRRNDSV